VADPRQSDESLIKLAGILVAEQSLEKTLRQVLDLACASLPGGLPPAEDRADRLHGQ
jgi:hypothetical protein